jgi:PAS domain S-box-containing protein
VTDQISTGTQHPSDDVRQLQHISTLLIQAGDIDALYERILDAAISLMSSDMASMQLFAPERGELLLLAQRGFHPDSAAFWQVVHLNSACTCGLALASGARIVVPDVDVDDVIAGTDDHVSYQQSGIRAVQSTPLTSRSGQLIGMLSTHWREPHRPAERALKQFDVLARQAADLIERTQIETALRESEQRSRLLAAIVESSSDSILTKDLDGIITSWNKGAERIFGYSVTEAIGKPVAMLIPADRQDEGPAILDRVRRGERVEHYETTRQRKDGSQLAIVLTVSPIRNASDEVIGASEISRDVTDRKQIEAHVAMLVREAEHRTKNILATVQAAVHMSRSDTVDGLKQAIEGRIQALANVHGLFVQSRWEGADLRRLLSQELAAYGRDAHERTRIDGPDLVFEPNAAQAIGMVLHELATNAAKYGALSVSDGRIHVAWSNGDDRIVLRWVELDGPPVRRPARHGLGTRLIDGLLRHQLKGEARFDWRVEGLACEIAIHASNLSTKSPR